MNLVPVGDKIIVRKIKGLVRKSGLLLTGADNQNYRDGQGFLLECYRVVGSNTDKIKVGSNVLVREMALIEIPLNGLDYLSLDCDRDRDRNSDSDCECSHEDIMGEGFFACDINNISVAAEGFMGSFDKNFMKEVSRYDTKS